MNLDGEVVGAPIDVLVVGAVGVDHIVNVESLAFPDVDSILVPPIRTYVGHSGNGVARGSHALGLATHVVDVIGEDVEGRLILEAYAAAGVPFTPFLHPSGTRRSVNLVTPDGGRLSLYDTRHPFDLVPDASLWREPMGRARHVHVSIVTWGRYALADAVARGCSTSTDLHDWNGRDDYHRDFAYGADLVFCSAAVLAVAAEEVAGDVFARGRARAVVLTDGARGSHVYRRDRPVASVPAVTIPGRPAVDTNGAGDSFVAAFLSVVLAGGTPDDAARAGAVAGAWACGTPGTHTSFIDRPTMEQLLRG